MKKENNKKMTIHCILTGVIFNGFIQGLQKTKLNTSVLDEAQKELEKLLLK